MRITDRIGSSQQERTRRFPAGEGSEDSLRPGALVCLVDDRNDLIVAKQGARNWELQSQPYRGRFSSLPVDSLFVILRRGSHIGFQSLG